MWVLFGENGCENETIGSRMGRGACTGHCAPGMPLLDPPKIITIHPTVILCVTCIFICKGRKCVFLGLESGMGWFCHQQTIFAALTLYCSEVSKKLPFLHGFTGSTQIALQLPYNFTADLPFIPRMKHHIRPFHSCDAWWDGHLARSHDPNICQNRTKNPEYCNFRGFVNLHCSAHYLVRTTS